jgi:hypothetical protein
LSLNVALQHKLYNVDEGTFPNDIAILTLATQIQANGVDIQYASLPDNNDEQFIGHTCVISGWGRTRKYLAKFQEFC